MPSLTRALTRCWRLPSMLLHNDSYTGSPGVGNMNQLTVRGFDDQLVDRIRRLAKRDGTSLDHLIGSWSDEEAAELDAALEEFEVIDEASWR